MADKANDLSVQLKEACKITGAHWALWLNHVSNGWDFGLRYALSRPRLKNLNEFIHDPKTASWMAGALSSGRTRSRDTGAYSVRLGCQRLYLYSNNNARCVLLVGADQLDKQSEGFFRILSKNPQSTTHPISVFNEPLSTSRWPHEVELEASYVPESVLRNVLEYLAEALPCDAAYMAIRFGGIFRVQAVWHCPPSIQGIDISIQKDETLNWMVANQQGIVLNEPIRASQLQLASLMPDPIRSWMGVPIVIGQRMIGFVAFISSEPDVFEPLELQQTTDQIGRLAYTVENAIVFAEAARYLQQLAMLNELASAASLGVDTDEVSRRVVLRLQRTFGTDRVAVFLLSPDGKSLRLYGGETRNSISELIPLETTLVGYVVETGLPARIGDVRIAPRYRAANPDVRSELAVPLKYRGKVIGTLALESTDINAFSLQDEQLLVVIASHLAGLIENVRLNEEMRERAHKLQDSVRQLQAIRETALDITGDLDLDILLKRVVHRARELVDARGAELGLLDEKEEVIRILVSENPWYSTLGSAVPLMAGVAGRVAAFGEPLVIADYNSWNGRLEPDRKAPYGVVAGVPLKFHGQVMGTLTVMDDRPGKVFRSEDMELLELLAPQVAVSIRNARLYQELQERIEAQRVVENRLILSARLAAVGEMAAGVAHELNNPLTTVTGFVELVLDEMPPDSPNHPDLELVLREAQRAKGVVRRMLDFSRPVESQRVRTDLNELISDVLALVHHLVRTHGVEIQIELWDGLPKITVDPNQIKQVLLNLVHNALQAMPAGGILSLRTAPVEREGMKWVTVSVRDTGEGITPENLKRIFEPFFTTRPTGGGTGLGLSISYGIITDHGGFIDVDTQVGQGSCFTIYLPLDSNGVHA
jgi:signal transduction histidine kinase